MSTITIRLNKEEQEMFEEYAKLHELPLSTLLKKTLEEKISEEFDFKMIKQYENKVKKGSTEFFEHDELKKELGL